MLILNPATLLKVLISSNCFYFFGFSVISFVVALFFSILSFQSLFLNQTSLKALEHPNLFKIFNFQFTLPQTYLCLFIP